MPLSAPAAQAAHAGAQARPFAATLAALGVVYGDIGTSPLYATRECFNGPHAFAPTAANVMGVVSLIVWSLILVISVKYLGVIMRADNDGEGGILALMALVSRRPPAPEAASAPEGAAPLSWLALVGLFGAALLYGDGAITPAISVLSAVEGVAVAAPAAAPFVLPLTVLILLGLFAMQRQGTAKMGALFGPITLAWFVCIAALGIRAIVAQPAILLALDPRHAAAFFGRHGGAGILVLGAIFLAVTGGEALYADMGHFGRRPIQRAWFAVALPALTLNYMGQGALLLSAPQHADNPFFHMAPPWALAPLVGLATLATVIASQAVITGAFSLTWQAVQLGYLPRVAVRHTSAAEIGQVYLPTVNLALCLATVALVLSFGTSGNLASAYGIAVTTTMGITSLLALQVMRHAWHWPLPVALAVTGAFLVLDGAFFGANIVKVADGGWLPLGVAAAMLLVMTTWARGRQLLALRLEATAHPLAQLPARLRALRPARTPGTAIFMTSAASTVPAALDRLLHHLNALPSQVVVLTVQTARVPKVAAALRRQHTCLDAELGLRRVVVHCGFLERPRLPQVVADLVADGAIADADQVFYVLGRETVLATARPGMALWRERLFAFMARNASRAVDFYSVPPASMLEIGAHIDL